MKCTDNDRIFRKKRKRKTQLVTRIVISVLFIAVVAGIGIWLLNSRRIVETYEASAYTNGMYEASLFADDLCVSNEEVEFKEFYRHDKFKGALLFNLKDNEVLYSERVNEKVYPASTTKIMTTYLALKYGDLNDTVTVSEHAVDVPSRSSVAGLRAGDRLTLKDLLYGLMLPSGNDSAIAIAEHISGDVEAFADLMNEEANKLGASNTHFTNPHGYHENEHYTTAYDLYLMWNACMKEDLFMEIVSSRRWNAVITQKDGSERAVTWNQTNKYLNGTREVPKGITMIGGKTGTTNDAGYCLMQYGKDSDDIPYLAIIMGATSSRNLYDNMTFLWMAIAD